MTRLKVVWNNLGVCYEVHGSGTSRIWIALHALELLYQEGGKWSSACPNFTTEGGGFVHTSNGELLWDVKKQMHMNVPSKVSKKKGERRIYLRESANGWFSPADGLKY